MTDVVARAKQPLDPNARMEAYYYSFDNTGIGAIDNILSQVATAGKWAHHTESWWDEPWCEYAGSKVPMVDRIQQAAIDSAELVRELADEVDRLQRLLQAFINERPQYITALKNCSPENTADYWRWQGHAEARRQLSEGYAR